MAQEKLRMPSSEGGLVRYYDEEGASKLSVAPGVIVGLCIAVIVITLALNAIY